MKSRWDDAYAQALSSELEMRAYSSRLLGLDEDLVLHGGGNTSLKGVVTDFAGDEIPVLWVKGSGGDLATITEKGFAPVRMKTLLAMAERESLSDTDMVKHQRAAMLDPDAPLPSIEAVLHALIPLPWVDHTHADSVVTISNAPGGEKRLRDIYGESVLYVPYVMPGFDLARAVLKALKGLDVRRYEGMILLHHGVFSWGDSAKESYERMIALVDRAERYLENQGAFERVVVGSRQGNVNPHALAELRRQVAEVAQVGLVARVDRSEAAVGFASRPDIAAICSRGPVTPDHVIRTKRTPLVLPDTEDGAAIATHLAAYVEAYHGYFERHRRDETELDPAPRWCVWRGRGIVSFGRTVKDADIVGDIARHTARCIQVGEALGGWGALPEDDIFRMEYWELEQRKLRSKTARPELEGKVALVTGAAHGIGRAVVLRLRELGANVVGLDRDEAVSAVASGREYLPIRCDVTDGDAVDAAISAAVTAYGGLDLLVSNAGSFPPSERISDLSDVHWEQTLALNLDSHMKVLRAAAPHLCRGIEPSVVFNASKNVLAPGPGVGAYSVAKAGLTQLARVAAIELGEFGVRVNMVHPDAVFDTQLWSPELIESRAKNYGMSPEAYRRRNLLKREVRARDVAMIVTRLLGPEFAATTGAQVPIDGGNLRVI
jgi:rhamnose utilization protein RhaD (predicted bifunctional aldolase and dehydrogenase)/NAD(P)-dependent dehydrogenase (short-subunit alcohol dehydrogenase family)